MSAALPPEQHTLARPLRIRGQGLHSGRLVWARICPAPPDHGVVFERVDLRARPRVPARLEQVRDGRLATTLGDAPGRVATVEHLLAALYALGVDNARVEVHGPELPAVDGSARPWTRALERAGRIGQGIPARVLRVLRPVELRLGARGARLLPAAALELGVVVDFPHPLIGRQALQVRADPQTFCEALCWARTFGLEDEVVQMRAAGLARGGDLGNAVVYGAQGVLNPEGRRAWDEPVRHKTLDLLGDLALLGLRLQAQVEVERPGHAFTHALLQHLLAQPDAWERV